MQPAQPPVAYVSNPSYTALYQQQPAPQQGAGAAAPSREDMAHGHKTFVAWRCPMIRLVFAVTDAPAFHKAAQSSRAADGLLAGLADWPCGVGGLRRRVWRTWRSGLAGLSNSADCEMGRTVADCEMGGRWRTVAGLGGLCWTYRQTCLFGRFWLVR
eukprot:gene15430-biopygen1567